MNAQLLDQLTQAVTYRELQKALKSAKNAGFEVSCKLNASKENLQVARNTLVAKMNQVDEEKEITSDDLIAKIEREIIQIEADREKAESLWVPAINPDGENLKLGNYAHLYGTTQFELLMKIAVNEASQQIDLYRSFYKRQVELGLIDHDPGLDGDWIIPA